MNRQAILLAASLLAPISLAPISLALVPQTGLAEGMVQPVPTSDFWHFYFGLSAGYGQADARSTNTGTAATVTYTSKVNTYLDGFSGGVFIGANYMINDDVAVGADFRFTDDDINGNYNFVVNGIAPVNDTIRLRYTYQILAHLGAAFVPHTMTSIIGGWGASDIKNTFSSGGVSSSNTKTFNGPVIGAMTAIELNRSWTLSTDYTYTF